MAKKVTAAVHHSYICEFVEVLHDMGYRTENTEPSRWCIFVDVFKPDRSEIDQDDIDIIKTVKEELRHLKL